jgi:hypothetical protein
MLAPAGVDVDTFTARLKARKVFRNLWYGEDLLSAHKSAPALVERTAPALVDRMVGAELPAAGNRGNRTRRRSARAARPGTARAGAKLDAYIFSLKGNADE